MTSILYAIPSFMMLKQPAESLPRRLQPQRRVPARASEKFASLYQVLLQFARNATKAFSGPAA